ncbi:uncharacterized protein [Aegilops tauschii subsp. strangulata]|uniref:uncharacterized protein n=1 Tax=Aegilops tauschii subsp. strangulata TaxID=200361 RepID=UPI001ABBE3B8|nr:uncharacterized protein LOC120966606 [Aegilops tauschii subsp. strangulata]
MKAASASHTLFAEIRPVVADLATWKPHQEQSVADLRQELGGVRQEIDLIARNPVLALKPSDLPLILPRPSSAPFPNGGSSSQGPDGHRIDLLHRGVALGLLPPYSRLRPREEALEISKRREPRRWEGGSGGGQSIRSRLRGAMPLPAPPGRPPPAATTATDDRRGATTDSSRSGNTVEDRLSALKAYRRAKGLCYLCGEKWGREHKCATTVQLHVVQEMFDVLGFSGLPTSEERSDSESECHTISRVATQGTVAPQTIRLQGKIQ